MLDQIRSALKAWSSELGKLEQELETAKQRREYLQTAPLPAAELADIVVADIVAKGKQEFERTLGHVLATANHDPMNPNRPGGGISSPPILRNPYGGLGAQGGACAHRLAYLLREPLGAAIKDAISTFDGYPEAGPPLAERRKELAKLEKQIATTSAAVERLRADARSVGLDSAALHVRSAQEHRDERG